MSIDITINYILRLLLVFIFVRAALHKVSNYQHFNMQLNTYRLLPHSLIPACALLLTLTEGFLAITLLKRGWVYPSIIAAAVLILYAGAMSINLVKGRFDLDCGCTGPSGTARTISWALVIRNTVLAIFAMATALPITSRNFSTQEFSTIFLASVAVLLMYASIEQAIANQQRQRQYVALKSSGSAGVSA